MQQSTTSVSVGPYAEKLERLSGRLATVIRGKDDVIRDMVIALVAGGSVLIEDVPGVGKTTLAKTLANSVGLDFNRVQSTPDLLPSDFFGFSVLNPQIGEFTFRSGPIFCNLLLVDEINRASPRTQAALLEAMAERQVTIEGTRYELERPFLVLATQNPAEHRGTFPLPESQLDRFLFQLSMNYPDSDSEIEMLYGQTQSDENMTDGRPVLSKEELLQCHSLVRGVYVERTVADYMVRIARRTREHDQVVLGSSPRATLMIFQASQGKAFLEGRDHVLPDDVQHVTPLVLRHRLMLARGGAPGAMEVDEIIAGILRDISVPV
ncbi:MAG: AAA family ATPase [Planctomycetota bacterium]